MALRCLGRVQSSAAWDTKLGHTLRRPGGGSWGEKGREGGGKGGKGVGGLALQPCDSPLGFAHV